MSPQTPKIVCFSCRFGWGYLEDPAALEKRLPHWIPVACSGKVDAVHVLKAFRAGADGVLILGCDEGDCHFQDGNYQTLKKTLLLKEVLRVHGIEPERLRIVLGADPEGRTIPGLIEKMAAELSGLGKVRGEQTASAQAI